MSIQGEMGSFNLDTIAVTVNLINISFIYQCMEVAIGYVVQSHQLWGHKPPGYGSQPSGLGPNLLLLNSKL